MCSTGSRAVGETQMTAHEFQMPDMELQNLVFTEFYPPFRNGNDDSMPLYVGHK